MTDRTDDRIVALVGRSDGTSRIRLQAELGLPSATVTSAVARLLRRGELVEEPDPTHRSRSGRRPALLKVPGDRPLLGLVEWQGHHLHATLASFSGAVLARSAHPADAGDGLREPIAALSHSGYGRLASVVVSVAAPYKSGLGSPKFPPGGSRPSELPGAPGWPAALADDAGAVWSQRLGIPVLLENDANLELMGECAAGTAVGLSDVIYVKLTERSTGAGLLLGGQVHRGAHGFAGELAHVHLVDDGALCACGGRGCLSTRLGPALLDSVRDAYGQPVTFAEILRLADGGEPAPVRILGDVGRMVGRALANVVTFLNPAAVVIDGSVGPAARHVVDGVREPIGRYTSPVAAGSLRILTGTLGGSAALHGAIDLSRRAAATAR